MTSDHLLQKDPLDMFSQSQSWLTRQPGMQPLDPGIHRLLKQIDGWLAEYSRHVCEQEVSESQEDYPKYSTRLWNCWSYHWQQAAEGEADGRIDGVEVARHIQAGRGYRKGGKLGGDPLRDVVLAVAMTLKDSQAPVRFESEFQEFCELLAAKKIGPELRHSGDQWWNDFLDHLAGYTHTKPKLDKFAGKCALRNWLGTVLWRFLFDWMKANSNKGGDDALLSDIVAEEVEEDPARQECRTFFAQIVGEAFQRLRAEERLTLQLLLIDGLPNKEVAHLLRVDPGTMSRRKNRALGNLHKVLQEVLAEKNQEQSFADCMEYISRGGARDFATALFEFLQQRLKDEGQQI